MAYMTAATRNRLWRFGSLMPAALLLLVLSIYPIFNLAALSVSDVSWADGHATTTFVGWTNFHELFTNQPVYWAGVRNTIVFALIAVTAQMLLGFSMALVVSRAGGVGRSVLTAIFLLPIVIPPIVIGAMWRLLLGRDFGAVNHMLMAIGLPQIDFLGNADIALYSVIGVDVWHWTPFVFLLMLTGLESLDQEVFDAARFDVKSRWQELRHITIPLMIPTILITLGLRLVLSFKVFDEIYLLTAGGPGTATEVINFSIYRTFFSQDRTGLGSAMSLLTLIAVAVLIVAVNTWIRTKRKKEASQ
ncbi:sugar ABC transporter permease [Thioclava sp. BHET1]|nr:sugar ABC transporter permease [Thioclava sp. BHET1]